MTNQVLASDGVAMARMALRTRRSSWRRYFAAFVLLATLIGCQSAEKPAEPIEVPLTSFDSSVVLNISVGFFNGRLLFTNQSMVDLDRILVIDPQVTNPPAAAVSITRDVKLGINEIDS